MCNCINEIQKSTYERIVALLDGDKWEVLPLNVNKGEGLEGVNVVFPKKNNVQTTLQLKVLFKFRYRARANTNKGLANPRIDSQVIYFKFCPFCGESYSKIKKSTLVSDVYIDLIKKICANQDSMARLTMTLLNAINETNKTNYTGVTYNGILQCGHEGGNMLTWGQFMRSSVLTPIEI